MGVTSLELNQLDRGAQDVLGSGTEGYLSDVMQCLRAGDPIDALAMVHALWGTGFAKRDQQKDAVEGVERWLHARLRREPGISVGRLALELGWLRRMVVIRGHSDASEPGDDRGFQRPQRGRAPAEQRQFEMSLESLRRERRRALAAVAAMKEFTAEVSAEPGPPDGGSRVPNAPRRPDCLPDIFEASFVSWTEAVDAFKVARRRRKDGKAIKERLLAVLPTSSELHHLASGMCCSMLGTVGLDALQDRAAVIGSPPPFWISCADFEQRGDQRVALRISLAWPGARPSADCEFGVAASATPDDGLR